MFRLVANIVLLDSGLRQNDGWGVGPTGLPVPVKAGAGMTGEQSLVMPGLNRHPV